MKRQLTQELPYEKSKWEPDSTLEGDNGERDLIPIYLSIIEQLA